MPTEEIFYSVFWISMFSVIWFYTDFVIHYAQLLGICLEMRLDYMSYVIDNPDKYFPDYLYDKSLSSDDSVIKFAAKIISCPFCLLVWLSMLAAIICSNFIIAAPIYVISLFVTLQIKRML